MITEYGGEAEPWDTALGPPFLYASLFLAGILGFILEESWRKGVRVGFVLAAGQAVGNMITGDMADYVLLTALVFGVLGATYAAVAALGALTRHFIRRTP